MIKTINMKKIFTHLFAVLLLSFVATNTWAQITFTVDPSKGSYSGTGTYCTGWTSNSEDYPETKISVSVNNMATSPASSSSFEIATGQTSPSTWYLMVDGCRILSYSFKCKLKESTSSITVTAGDNSYVMTTEEQTVEVSGLDNVQKASFQLSGDNKHLVVTELTFTASPILEEGCVYMFKNARADRSLRADDDTKDVHTKTTDAEDKAQQWYVTKEGDYYVLRNLAYGKYLKGAATQKTDWTLTDDYSHEYNKFELHVSNTTLNTLKTCGSDGYGYMHDDTNADNGGCNVVGWLNGDGNTGSHWTITKVDYTAEQITALLEKAPTVAEIAAYVTSLEALFTDKACVTPALGSLAEAQASNAYKALPTGLKAMVDKVYNEKTEGVAFETAWAENNANATKAANDLNWSGKYAKKFRVQMYEPYSIAGDITGFLRMNAHSNNDNPTGIYVAEPGTVYVMVEGTIKDGASLRLHRAASNYRITNPTGEGYALTTGLNVINITEVNDGGDHLYICYNVDTYNPDGATVEEMFPHKLSEYSPLKIHIEGGAINGFYNAQGDFRASALGAEDDLWYQNSGASYDCDADWVYMEERANLAVLPIVSNRQVMLFQLEDTNGSSGTKTLLPESVTVPTVPNYFTEGTPTWDDYGMGCNPETGKINIWMETWDRIMYAELATLGLIQKSEIDKMNQFYPRWNADGTRGEIYNYDAAADGVTYQDFCRGLDYSEYYNHHGVALGTESGFMSAGWHAANYNINTLSSLVTMAGNYTDGENNYAVDIWGPAHEIGHQFQDVFNIRGGTEVTNNVFSNAAVWYQGGQTSRYNWGGLDSALSSFNSGLPFIDYNIWSMTQMFYKLWLYYHLAGNNTQFYPRFFEMLRVDPLNAKGATATGTESMLKIYEKMCDAAGEDLTEFFRAHGFFVLLDNYPKGDYGTTIFTQTQEEVDAAIARVKEKYDKENYAVLLINDLTTEILCHDGVNKRKRFDGTPASEYGTVDNFINGNATAANGGAYTATYNSDGTVTMEGEGGIGFLIFDETGKLVSFSYNSTFALSDEALETIMTGNATIVSVGTDVDAEPVTATIDLSAMQKEILGTLIAKAQPIIDKIDTTYTKIGFYKGAAVADLAEVLEYAKEVYAGSAGYEAAYDLLYAELKKVEANPDAKIPFDPSLTYIITNYAYPSRTMTLVDGVVYANTNVDVSADAAKWQFKETSATGVYNVYNCGGTYCGTISGSTAVTTTTEQASASNYTIDNLGDGLWAISLNPAGTNTQFHAAANDSYKVVGWNTSGNATKWYLTAVEPNATIADLTNLEVYINKTEALLGEVLGTVTYTRGENITLQTTTEGSAGYIWSNAPCATEGNIANLVDGATNNYFHTEWNGDAVTSGTHYIAVDLGEDNTLSRFAFSHTTRPGDITNDFPKSVDVYGSDDNVTYKYLGSASGMPQTPGTFWQYDGMMVASHRYLRFNVHANRGYWHMAEFDIMPVTGFTATVNDTYSSTVTVGAVTAAMEALLNGKSVAFSMSPTKETIDPVLEVLETAYKALYTEYEATITARKNTLAQLVTETNELIDQVGTVQLSEVTPVELKESNFYCNAPYIATQNADYSAGYVSKLTDGNNSTYLHTRWNANSDDGDFHYLRVDAGDTPIDLFQFTYTTVKRSKKDMPLTMVVEGANEIDGVVTTKDESFTQIAELTPLPEVLNANTVYKSEVLGSAGTKYRYLRFKVTDITVDESDGNGHPFFTMAEFGISSVVEEKVTVNESYKSNVSDNLLLSSVLVTNSSDSVSKNPLVTSVPLLDAQIADQQAAKDKLYAAMNNTAALKENLKKLIDDTQALYDKMATDEGAVNEYYRASALTDANLSEAMAEIGDAQTVYDNSSATVEEINTAFDELNVKYGVLNGIEALNVADRSELNTLITTMLGLLEQTTVNGAVEVGNVALQVTDKTAPFYIWNYKPATDDDGIAALIDETDGTANTGTFTGTYWQSGAVEPYTHYLEIDMGVNNVLEDLSIDYTTRNSTHANQRPDALKFLGSNNKVDYEEFYSVTTGLPADANTKWTMPVPIELAKNYRYVRIAVSTDVGYFNMSDFNLYSNNIATVNEFYSTSEIFDCLPAVLRGYRDAKDAVAVYMTESEYDAAKVALQAQIDALQAVIDANVSDRTSLEGLITQTNPLIEEVATVSEEEAAIAMQCTDVNAPYYLYCNADGTETNGSGDKLGVTALLDNDANTHLHTTYGDNAQDDNLDHYLRLDMGKNEAMMSFKFSYIGRSSNSNNDPSTMVIEGCNTLDGEWAEIVTLTGLPTDGDGVQYNSELIESDKAYRYIRFMVTKTQNGSTNNGHPFFVLSKFSVTACKTIEVKTEYVSPNLPLSTLVTANNEVVEASAMVDDTEHYVTETAYSTAKNELQAARDALELAKNLKELPVILTTDENNPVLYKIKIKRNENVFTYKGETADASKKPVLAASELGNRYQAWYFMQGTNAGSYGDVLIMPYYNEGTQNTTLRLSYANNNEGTEPVVVASETNTTDNWYITFTEGSTTEGWWNLQPEGGMDAGVNAFVNQYGGTNSTKLAFWRSANNPSDPGSQFQFVLDETNYSLSDAYYALYNLHVSYGGTKVAGTAIGCYISASVDEYNAAYQSAAELLETATAGDDEYRAAYEALETAYNSLERIMPVAGGLYRLKSAYSGRYSDGKYIYADTDNSLYFSDAEEALSKYIWQFEEVDGGYYVKNLHTDSYISTAAWATQVILGDSPGKIILEVLDDATGILGIKTVGHHLHAQDAGSKVVGYNGGLNTASAWYVEELENVEEAFNHTETLSALGYGTLMLNYDAKVPDGVKAYVANNIEGSTIVLSPIEGDIIPANTAVILKKDNIDGNTLDMPFKYSTAETGSYEDNMLRGTLFTKVVKCDTDDVNNNIYMMQNKDGAVKMYWMYENYNAEGQKVQDDNGSTNNDLGGYVKCSANRAYLVVPQSTAQNSAAYSFRFAGPATGIDEIESGNGMSKGIYDLQGRKYAEITEPGIYIVDGKKVVVK